MNTFTCALSEEQIPQKVNNDGYLLTINGTTVRIRFNGEKSLTACLADVFNRMAGKRNNNHGHCEAFMPWQSHKAVNPRFINDLWDSHGAKAPRNDT